MMQDNDYLGFCSQIEPKFNEFDSRVAQCMDMITNAESSKPHIQANFQKFIEEYEKRQAERIRRIEYMHIDIQSNAKAIEMLRQSTIKRSQKILLEFTKQISELNIKNVGLVHGSHKLENEMLSSTSLMERKCKKFELQIQDLWKGFQSRFRILEDKLTKMICLQDQKRETSNKVLEEYFKYTIQTTKQQAYISQEQMPSFRRFKRETKQQVLASSAFLQMKKDISDLKQDVRSMKEDVKNLKEDSRSMKEDVKNLKEDVKNIKEDVKNLKEDVKNIKEDVVNLKEDVKNIKEDVKGMKNDIFDLKNGQKDMMHQVKETRNDMKRMTEALSRFFNPSAVDTGSRQEAKQARTVQSQQVNTKLHVLQNKLAQMETNAKEFRLSVQEKFKVIEQKCEKTQSQVDAILLSRENHPDKENPLKSKTQ